MPRADVACSAVSQTAFRSMGVARALRSVAAAGVVSPVLRPTVPNPTIRAADPFGEGCSIRDNAPDEEMTCP